MGCVVGKGLPEPFSKFGRAPSVWEEFAGPPSKFLRPLKMVAKRGSYGFLLECALLSAALLPVGGFSPTHKALGACPFYFKIN